MNTKMIVALVIGVVLVGLTGAATAAVNEIHQNTASLGLMIGGENVLGQNSMLSAAICGASKDNIITQDLIQFALAINEKDSQNGNNLQQNATQSALINNGEDNVIDQRIWQAGVAFGNGNGGLQVANQFAVINDSEDQFIDQVIDQIQIAFAVNYNGVCDCINGSLIPPIHLNESACDPCLMLEEACNNDATQMDTQIAIIEGGPLCIPSPG